MLEVCFKALFGCSLLQLLRLACVSYITVVMFKTILMSNKLRLGGEKYCAMKMRCARVVLTVSLSRLPI